MFSCLNSDYRLLSFFQFATESDVILSRCRRLMTKYCNQLMSDSKYVLQTQSLNDFSGIVYGTFFPF